MREIKFKFWDTTLKEFTKYYSAPPQDIFEFDQSRYIALQYTGLKDKNGKEIYESDIVKLTCGCGHQENLPIEWRDGHNGYFAKAKWQHNWDNNQLELNWSEHCEVIGNIWEHPELLVEK